MRKFLCCLLMIGLIVGAAAAQEEPETPASDGMEKMEESVKKAIAYLLSQQNDDGFEYNSLVRSGACSDRSVA
jgi:hypothetical protein